MKAFLDTLRTDIAARMKKFPEFLLVATVLDPRFLDMAHVPEDRRVAVETRVRNEVRIVLWLRDCTAS